ncbi:MarR family winged helix-turn-helix transcriptional regulator [Streptomyces griseosporeus]|uniref:MarR family winged helix-turn-helix transcriptional regulator n=1 Tax=Streptomyces griseosporeus TaxID=1910 RepID=UPI0036F8355E
MVNMVDDEMVNQVSLSGKEVGEGGGQGRQRSGPPGPGRNSGAPRPRAGYELPLLLFAGFRTLIDELHTELARQGHPDARPAHGFALQAIGPEGSAATDIARRLGISKQAAGKTVDRLVALGYAERADDPADARRKLVRLTARGFDLLARSAAIFERLRAEWAAELGEERVSAMEDDLGAVVSPGAFRLDAAGWIGGAM